MPSPTPQEPSALTEAAKDSLLGHVADLVASGLAESYYAGTDFPGFLADPNPTLAHTAPLKSITRLACRSYARGGGPQNLPGFDAAWGGICGPYLESIGEEPNGGSLAPPFEGGQCPTNYIGRVFLGSTEIQQGGGAPRTLTGPLGGVTKTETVTNQPAAGGVRVTWTFGNNGANNFLSIQYVPGFTPEPRFTLETADGSPDSCGNPPAEYTPPSAKPGLPPVPPEPVEFPGIGPTPISVEFNPQGQIVVNLPDVGVEVPIDAPIDISLGGDGDGGGGGEAPPPGDVGEPGSPALSQPGGETEGDAPEGSVLVGLHCEILAFPDSRNKYTSEVFRGAYYAYMGVPGLLDLDPGGAMVRTSQFLFAEKENLTSWRVSANTGYVIRTTPYYRSAE